MLKTIIKRKNKREEFSPEKLNKWALWAAESVGDRVDWSSIVLDTVKECPDTISSQDLQLKLIDTCLSRESWPYYKMAGNLYASYIHKKLYSDNLPTVKELHSKLRRLGLMKYMKYSSQEYDEIESIIDHKRDHDMTHFQIDYIQHKYSVQDKIKKTKYESPQFTYMRMAMALAENESEDVRMLHLKNWYNHFSFNRINAPTPNYVNLGTPDNGLASCCLYVVDDNAKSLAIGDHIAYTMTYMSAGIGNNLNVRSLGDPVKSGKITHMGKFPYFESLAKAVKANVQGGRGGACTTHFTCYDPQVISIIMAQNPKTPVDAQNRDIHFSMLTNRLFTKKFLLNEQIFSFNKFTAPDLMELFYSDKQDEFEELYEKYESDPSFKKTYHSARDILIKAGQQGYEVSTLYYVNIDEANRHTPFKEPIYSSNLCQEILEPTIPYQRMEDLYSKEDHGRGEIALCSLAGIVEPNIKSDEEYDSACYYALKMIDKCIDMSHYELPHLEVTAKSRRNAGVGLLGIATSMARAGKMYDTKSGRKFLHKIAERHSYFLIKNAIRLGKELGNAAWIHKTKWPEGWLPIDTYKQSVDELVDHHLKYDWESLRKELIENCGIRFSCLVAHMPTESSSKASGVPNGIYPVRDVSLAKSDSGSKIYWAATDEDLLRHDYQIAWNISEVDMLKVYAIFQKFADQGISADVYRDRTKNIEIYTDEIIQFYKTMAKYGVKTRYYVNSKTSDSESVTTSNCASGACTL